MPIPKPTASETQNDYVGRCMSEISGEYPQDQAVAICISTYQRDNMKKIKSMDKKAMARIKYDTNFRGINLAPLEKGPNDPCWENYVQVGTKIVDGREVPNCVPFEGELQKIEEMKGINLQEEGVSYPWDECIADQTARYGDEEIAKKVCGMIKSKYGS
jgi:hypothetical protein